MAAKKRVELDKSAWKEIDPTSLSDEQQTAYQDYKTAYLLARDLRQEFEAIMQQMAPTAMHFLFGYNFGRLTMAVVPGAYVPQTKKDGPVSFDLLAKKPAEAPTETN